MATDKPVEEGWLRLKGLLGSRSAEELDNLRLVFFAGARHVFESMVMIAEEGKEPTPTEDDMKRVELIGEELEQFIQDFEMNNTPVGGHA